MKTKCVEWSYPTSVNALRFGFDNGCWTVSISEDNKPPVALAGYAVAGYAERPLAISHAEKLPDPWSRAFLTCHPEFSTGSGAKMNTELARFIAGRPGGFIRNTDIAEVIRLERLQPLLVRCGGCRFTAPAQDVQQIITALSAAGDYVRDVSFPATACADARRTVEAQTEVATH